MSGHATVRKIESDRVNWMKQLRVWLVVAGLAATGLALADPAPAGVRSCELASPREAEALADLLYEKSEYQRAGECYEAAGNPSRAQLAYLKAVTPNGKAAARDFGEQRDAAKALFAHVQQAFHKRQ
jgi:hypothetical protein